MIAVAEYRIATMSQDALQGNDVYKIGRELASGITGMDFRSEGCVGLAVCVMATMAHCFVTYARTVAGNPRNVRPRDTIRIEPSLPAYLLARELGLSGPVASFGGGRDGMWHAMGWAVAQLALRRASKVLVGGAEEGSRDVVWVLLGQSSACPQALAYVSRWCLTAGRANVGRQQTFAEFMREVGNVKQPCKKVVRLLHGSVTVECHPSRATSPLE